MNRSLQDIGGGLLLVPQFTLAADTRKGMRPSLTPAADPGAGEPCSPISASAARHRLISRRARRSVPRRELAAQREAISQRRGLTRLRNTGNPKRRSPNRRKT